MKNILITICARGGSKGIPGKNVKMINGKPLIGYTIDCAKKFKQCMKGRYSVDIVLSTDSEQIRKVAADCGLKSNYIRPDYLASDTSGKVDAIYDVFSYSEKNNSKQYDYILDLDCTSPLRTQKDLSEALASLEADTNALIIYSVSEPARNPYFNMVEQQSNGYYDVVKKLDSQYLSRQTAPKVYDLNASFYIYTRKLFELGYRTTDTDRSMIYLMDHLCFDLDNPIDFEFMSYLLNNNKLDFEI
ncbi:MAG: acylneuraminate cytidylyltransferase family protein [Bacteroidaceae bacterium]|nr:acylneuraminate cytidylyltransferase family protein [Bacteroidaceae bacterium]